jgi:cation diffusion facilitator family transporter
LIADGVNNLTDVGLSFGMFLAMKWSGKPPDRRHPYGHGRLEQEAARLVGVVIVATAGFLAMGAWHRVYVRHEPPDVLVLVVAVVGMGVKEGMYRYQRRLAARLRSLALAADALNHRADVGATLAVLLGTGANWYGGKEWAFWDDVAAFVVSGLMGASAARIIWLASRELLDETPPSDVLDTVRNIALKLADAGVTGTEKIHGRKSGTFYLLDLHLEVRPAMTVAEAHRVGHSVRDAIIEQLPSVSDVLVHIEPGREAALTNADGIPYDREGS